MNRPRILLKRLRSAARLGLIALADQADHDGALVRDLPINVLEALMAVGGAVTTRCSMTCGPSKRSRAMPCPVGVKSGVPSEPSADRYRSAGCDRKMCCGMASVRHAWVKAKSAPTAICESKFSGTQAVLGSFSMSGADDPCRRRSSLADTRVKVARVRAAWGGHRGAAQTLRDVPEKTLRYPDYSPIPRCSRARGSDCSTNGVKRLVNGMNDALFMMTAQVVWWGSDGAGSARGPPEGTRIDRSVTYLRKDQREKRR